MSDKISEKIEQLPKTPGVYKFFDEKNVILYIGKAVNLEARVSSYFKDSHNDRPRIISMIPKIAKIDYTETDNEVEALILESALIRQEQPYYNTLAKDDKSYAWLYVTSQDKYPTVKIVRNISSDEYKKGKLFGPYPSGSATKQVFRYLRKLYPFCTSKDPTKTCFHSRIGLCPGPNASLKEYQGNIKQIVKFLNGGNKNHLKELEKKMISYSRSKKYEKAAELRDRINDLRYLGTNIRYNYFNTEEDYTEGRDARIKRSLLALADEIGVKDLSRIECYDISNLSGQFTYGSMSVSIDGKLTPSLYRIFKLESEEKQNDPEMLRRVLNRRLKYLTNSSRDENLMKKPSLILIDGGKVQLGHINTKLISNIPIMGISKGKRLKRAGKKLQDEFWIISKNKVMPIKIKNIQILVSLRDEAHRFAIKYNKNARKGYLKESALDKIEGVGPKRRKLLLKTFGDVKAIRSASSKDLEKVLGNKKVVEKIIAALQKHQ